jgi:hypothetical protein
VTPPQPTAIRLVTSARVAKAPSAPFGLSAWSPEASARAVLLDASLFDLTDVGGVAAQIPLATSLPRRTLVAVLDFAQGPERSWRLPLAPRRVHVPLAIRCSALLVRGYVDIASHRDLGWAWSSRCDREA